MNYIDEHDISHKRVLLRVDFNVALSASHTIANDIRMRQVLPTIEYLLKQHNKIIIVTHLGRPLGHEERFSLKHIAHHLLELLQNISVRLIEDFLTESPSTFTNQKDGEIILLENIRYYPEEDANDQEFAKKLAMLSDVYVNDAFSTSHRETASIVGVPHYIPSFAGLLMKKEVMMLEKAIKHPQKPVVAILGGSKISSKIHLITKLITLADAVLLGGGIANTFLATKTHDLGKSLVEENEIATARRLILLAEKEKTALLLPHDVIVSEEKSHHTSEIKLVTNLCATDMILDLGPATLASYGQQLATARTILWNGPVGYFENPTFKEGTDFIYYAITQNSHAVSIVGGGDTLAALEKKEYLDKITHISTGGGAMLEFIENNTLPGIEALNLSTK
ncbi:phosphoglycerate kinase [soil metagenome]